LVYQLSYSYSKFFEDEEGFDKVARNLFALGVKAVNQKLDSHILAREKSHAMRHVIEHAQEAHWGFVGLAEAQIRQDAQIGLPVVLRFHGQRVSNFVVIVKIAYQ
jgi:hypothetical protein